VPSGGARAFCLLLRFSKVSRRKGGTHRRRYPDNGYAPSPRTKHNLKKTLPKRIKQITNNEFREY
jgi:hypothetical protein